MRATTAVQRCSGIEQRNVVQRGIVRSARPFQQHRQRPGATHAPAAERPQPPSGRLDVRCAAASSDPEQQQQQQQQNQVVPIPESQEAAVSAVKDHHRPPAGPGLRTS